MLKNSPEITFKTTQNPTFKISKDLYLTFICFKNYHFKPEVPIFETSLTSNNTLTLICKTLFFSIRKPISGKNPHRN